MSREPRRDWRAELGKHEGRSAHEALSDQVTAFRILFRIVLIPIWLPIWFWKVERRRRVMHAFAIEHLGNRTVDDDAVHEIVLAWANTFPDRYPLGEYDPRLRKLHNTFKRILERRK